MLFFQSNLIASQDRSLPINHKNYVDVVRCSASYSTLTYINSDFVFFMKNVIKKRVVERERNSFKEEGILRRNYCMEGD